MFDFNIHSLCALFLLKPFLPLQSTESLPIQLSIMRETSYIFVPIQVAPVFTHSAGDPSISGRLARDVQRRVQ